MNAGTALLVGVLGSIHQAAFEASDLTNGWKATTAGGADWMSIGGHTMRLPWLDVAHDCICAAACLWHAK